MVARHDSKKHIFYKRYVSMLLENSKKEIYSSI